MDKNACPQGISVRKRTNRKQNKEMIYSKVTRAMEKNKQGWGLEGLGWGGVCNSKKGSEGDIGAET